MSIEAPTGPGSNKLQTLFLREWSVRDSRQNRAHICSKGPHPRHLRPRIACTIPFSKFSLFFSAMKEDYWTGCLSPVDSSLSSSLP